MTGTVTHSIHNKRSRHSPLNRFVFVFFFIICLNIDFCVTLLSFPPPGFKQSAQKAEWGDRGKGECSGAAVPRAAGPNQNKAAGP